MKKILALIFLLLLFFPSKVYAVSDHIVINEFMPHPSPDPDWVELYNPTNSDIDISGWVIADSSTNKITIPSSTVLNAKQFIYYTFSNKLNNDGDTVRLKESEGSTTSIDEKQYLADPGINISIGRLPDGQDNWVTFNTSTPGSTNNPSSPTPVPTIVPTETPTITPTVTPTAAPTLEPTPTATPLPTEIPSPSPTIVIIPTPTILPSPSVSNSPSPTPISFQEIFEKRMICRFSYKNFKKIPNHQYLINLLKAIFGPQSICSS